MMLRGALLRAARLPAAGVATGLAASALAACSSQQHPAESASWFKRESYHVRYFDARGVMETARMCMVLAGKEFTDERWPLDFSKPRNQMSPKMAEARADGLLKANLDRAPVLVVNGEHEIGQSKSIERYLAKRLGLLGRDDIEASRIDAMCEHIRDLKDQYNKAKATPGEQAKQEALSGFFDAGLPDFLRRMEACVLPTKGAPLVGKALSLADVSLFVLLTEYFDNKQGVHAAMAGCPRLQGAVDAVGAHPNIQKYLKERPVTAI